MGGQKDRFGFGFVGKEMRKEFNENRNERFEYTNTLKPLYDFSYEKWGSDPKGNPLLNWYDSNSGTWFEDDRYGKNLPNRSLKRYSDSVYKLQEKHGSLDWDVQDDYPMPDDVGFKFFKDL